MLLKTSRLTSDKTLTLGIVLLSWGLLIWQLGQRSLWVDEFLTLQMIQGTPQEVIAAAMADLHPPLYFLALRGWTAWVGSSDFALRWFSIGIAIVGLALMSQVAQRWAGPRAAVPATLLLGTAPAFIEFGRMARYYSLLLTLSLLCTIFLLDALDHNNRKRWAAYVLTGLALLYTFYLSGTLLIAQGLVIVLPAHRRLSVRRGLMIALAIGVGFAPWLLVAGRQVARVSGVLGADLARSGLGFVLGIAASFYTFSVGETLFPWRPEAWIGLGIVAVLLGMGLLKPSRRAHWQSAGLFILSIISISTVTTFVAAGTPFLNVPVRGLFALPYYLLVVTWGWIGLASKRWRVVLGSMLLAVWGISLLNNFTNRDYLNPIYITPSKEAAAFVRRNVTPGDLVISDYDSVFGHYFLPGGLPSRHKYTDQVNEIQAALQTWNPPHVWLVTIGRDQTRFNSSSETVRQRLAANYRLEHVERYLPIDPVYLKIKNLLLRRDSYEYRLTVEVYARILK
jgi:Dolichyl-phosphate-mannose-protein mannosyltransferase